VATHSYSCINSCGHAVAPRYELQRQIEAAAEAAHTDLRRSVADGGGAGGDGAVRVLSLSPSMTKVVSDL
jgi:hypothetical protein